MRALSARLCRRVGRGPVLCVQMAGSDELLLVSSVQSLSLQCGPSVLDDRAAFSRVRTKNEASAHTNCSSTPPPLKKKQNLP